MVDWCWMCKESDKPIDHLILNGEVAREIHGVGSLHLPVYALKNEKGGVSLGGQEGVITF